MAKGLPRSLRNAGLTVPQGNSGFISRTIVFNEIVSVTATGAAIGFGSVATGLGFRQGNFIRLGLVANLSFTSLDSNAIAAWQGDYAIGTTAVDATTFDPTDENFLGSQALGATGGVVATSRDAQNANTTMLDLTASDVGLFINMLVDAASISDSTTAQFRVEGDISFAGVVLGDD